MKRLLSAAIILFLMIMKFSSIRIEISNRTRDNSSLEDRDQTSKKHLSFSTDNEKQHDKNVKLQQNSIKQEYGICPEPCQCRRDSNRKILTVDCSARNLTSIPTLPLTSINVSLQNNKITAILCQDLTYLRYLISLDLSVNEIYHIHSCSFKALTSLQNLDLSENKIKIIPSKLLGSLHNLQRLNVSKNNLKRLTSQCFRNLTKLRSLDMSYNAIRQLNNGTFIGLGSLLYLSLHSNKLSYINIDASSIDGLNSLETLELHGNEREFSDNFTYPDQALTRLPWLQRLTLDGHPQPLGVGFKYLMNLSSLSFGEIDATCNMLRTKMPENFFSNINTSQLLDVSLNRCNISFLPSGVFKYTPTINSLNLDDNNNLGFEGLEHGSHGLIDSNLTLLSINRIVHEQFEHGSHITNSTFKNLRRTKLRNLTIEHNFVEGISPVALRDLPPTVEYLSLFNNRLSSYFVFQDLILLKNLRVLQLSEQNIHINSNVYRGRVNALSSEKNVSRVTTSNLQTEMKNSDRCGGKEAPRVIVLPRRLEELYFNYAKGDVNNYFNLKILNNNVLRIYEYSQNNIRCIHGPITGIPSLERMDLSSNIITEIDKVTLSQMPNLKVVLVGNNFLGQCLADDTGGIILSNLSKLEVLDLHSNSIKDLAKSAFTFNHKLRILDLSNNELSFFKPCLSNNKKLENLDLSSNTLMGFSESSCMELKRLRALSPKFKVKIADNRFVCECRYLEFLALLTSQPEIFSDIESFHCRLRNGSQLYYDKLEEFLPILELQCISVSLFVCTLVVFFFTLMTLGIALTFYYKRWQWRYLHYLGQARLNLGAFSFIDMQQKDAFVTYNQDDHACRCLVNQAFLPRLRQFGLSFVFGETDFLAGRPLAPSIASAVAVTRKTLVVFSKDIFEDFHRELEINLAIMHELHLRKSVVVPVLVLEEIHNQVQERATPNNRLEAELAIGLWDQDYEPWMDSFTFFGQDGLSDRDWSLFEDMLASFPPEISHFLRSQSHRCLVYDGGSEEFWESLRYSLLEDNTV